MNTGQICFGLNLPGWNSCKCEIYNAVVICSVVGYSIFLSLKVVVLRENLLFFFLGAQNREFAV
jgi:hypothetical protein